MAAAVLLFAIAVLAGVAEEIAGAVAFFIALGACIRAVGLAVRDNGVSSATIRGPGGRVLGMMGAETGHARRRRRRERERHET